MKILKEIGKWWLHVNDTYKIKFRTDVKSYEQVKHNDVIATSESDSVHTAQATEPGEKLFK